jgi:NAD(P)-dependent dehydrogenase (short-subunit alcohol dehydrogenase family)
MDLTASSTLVVGGASGMGAATARLPGSDRIAAREIARTAFPKRLGRPDEYASLAMELLTNGYANGALVSLDAGSDR